MNRGEMTSRIMDRTKPWDMLVVGGGATGIGIAVVAASRRYDILLLEQSDFGKDTSSRSTKLIHGGVRSGDDILSVFTGVRPLVGARDDKNTASLSRGHRTHRETQFATAGPYSIS
jgi:glycerol-3-phosphate dehydrogenase